MVLHDQVSHLLVHGRIIVEVEYGTIMMIQVVSFDDLSGQLFQGLFQGLWWLLENASCIDEKGQCFKKKRKKKPKKFTCKIQMKMVRISPRSVPSETHGGIVGPQLSQ